MSIVKIPRDVPWKFISLRKRVDNFIISVDNYREKNVEFKKIEINHENDLMIQMYKFNTINTFKIGRAHV